MSSKVLEKFYTQKYSNETPDFHLIEYKKYPLTRNEAVFKYMIDNFEGGRILEIGIGDGVLARSLLKSHSKITEYVGIEFSASRYKALKESNIDQRLKVYHGNIEEFDQDIGQFDAIIMIALIEHLIEPLNTMKKIKNKYLKQHAFVYINTPNIADYGSRKKLLFGKFPSTASRDEGLTKYDGRDVNLYDEGHLHYFTFSSLRKMLERYCGFREFEIVPQPVGKMYFGKAIHYFLAKKFPTLFSEINLVAR